MSEILWTVALTATGIAGIWVIPHKPVRGWSLYLLNEAGWLVYAVTIHALPLFVMAVIWGGMGIKNLRLEASRAVH